MECYSAIKKGWDFAICSNMDDLQGIMLSEVSQTEKEKYLWYHSYVESHFLKMNLFAKQKQTYIKNKLIVTKGGTWRGG